MRRHKLDYTKLIPGIYKHKTSGLVTVWDIRVKTPNSGEYLSPAVMHTITHTMTSYMRYFLGSHRVIGVYPMSCQTGFYVVTRFVGKYTIYQAVINYIMTLQRAKVIPGANERQCGQYELHDLEGAQMNMLNYYNYIKYDNSAVKYTK